MPNPVVSGTTLPGFLCSRGRTLLPPGPFYRLVKGAPSVRWSRITEKFRSSPALCCGRFRRNSAQNSSHPLLKRLKEQRGQVSEMRTFCKEQISGSGWVRFGSGPGPVGSGLESGLIWFDLVFPGKGNRLTLFDMTYPCFSCPRVWFDLVESLV